MVIKTPHARFSSEEKAGVIESSKNVSTPDLIKVMFGSPASISPPEKWVLEAISVSIFSSPHGFSTP